MINPEARIEYELTCDAVKWMRSESGDSTALFSGRLGSSLMPSMNVPKVPEGLRWSLYRKGKEPTSWHCRKGINRQSIILKDKYLNKEVDLSLKNYSFQAEEGTFNDRFELLFIFGRGDRNRGPGGSTGYGLCARR